MNMVTGGVGFEALFALNVPPSGFRAIPYHVVNSFVWIFFLLLFPIVFKNLLVCAK